ncbi:MAG: hypothetical protein MPN21_02460, partial [Thermoanaerobaculia bacterium]|nr:hypothetical protein [Thermoanaerobaculia bacterium]
SIQAEALNALALSRFLVGREAEAAEQFEAAIAAARAAGNLQLVAGYSMNLANIRNNLGQHAQAMELAEEAVGIHRRFEHESDLARALLVWSSSARRAKRHEVAHTAAVEARELAERLGDQRRFAAALRSLAANHEAQKHSEIAVSLLEQLEALYGEMGAAGARDEVQERLAFHYLNFGRLEEARDLLTSLELNLRDSPMDGSPRDLLLVQVHLTFAKLEIRSERPDHALERLLDLQLRLLHVQRHQPRMRALGIVHSLEGGDLKTRAFYGSLERLAAEHSDPRIRLEAKLDQVRLLRLAGEIERARQEAVSLQGRAREAELSWIVDHAELEIEALDEEKDQAPPSETR